MNFLIWIAVGMFAGWAAGKIMKGSGYGMLGDFVLGILGGVESWGLIGLVLGPALMAVLMLLWREWVGAIAGPLNPAARPEPAGGTEA